MMKINKKGFNMEDYIYTIDTIKSYKNKACELAKDNCERCEAQQEYYCCFDTVIRFIEYANNNLTK